jgi:glutamate 5-kinase
MASVTQARRLVVKIGSALLVERGRLRSAWLAGLALDVAEARARGTQVILVSSGSIALGRAILGLPTGALALEQSQAAAAVGQIRLARAYEEALAPHGIVAGQVLVTLEDSANRRRYLNSRATMEQLIGLGVVPIVNENDTVATDEIRYGDNDRLAAQIAVTIGADQLVLLSDVDGFYSANPKEDPSARRFDTIERITPAIEAMAGDPVSGISKGGMKTKIMAAKTATAGGCAMAITLGMTERPLTGARRRRPRHMVSPRNRPARGAQALDRRHETQGRDHGRRRRSGGAREGQVAPPRGRHGGRGQLRPRRPGHAILGPAGDHRLGYRPHPLHAARKPH